MCGARRLPGVGVVDPGLRALRGIQGDASLQTDRVRIPARLVGVTTNAVDDLAALIAQGIQREPAVGQPRDTPHGHVQGHRTRGRAGADPDGNGALHGQRLDAGVVDAVPLSGVIDNLLRPQQPQDLDLLFAALAARFPVFVQSLILHRVPSDPDAQPQPPAAQHVHFRGLLGHQRGLPLRQDDDAGGQFQIRGNCRQVRHQREGLVDIALVRVVESRHFRVELRVGPQYVVQNPQMRIPQLVRGLHKIPRRSKISPNVDRRKRNPNLHHSSTSPEDIRHPQNYCNAGQHKTFIPCFQHFRARYGASRPRPQTARFMALPGVVGYNSVPPNGPAAAHLPSCHLP